MTIATTKKSRRNFFRAAAAIAGWTLICSKRASAAAAPQTTGLGFSLYGMKTIPIGAALKALMEIGYDCTELPVMPDWPAESAKLTAEGRRAIKAQLDQRGIKLSAIMENLPTVGDDAQHRANLERLRRAAEVARDLAPGGEKPAPLIETILGGKAGEFEIVKGRLVDCLGDWAKVAADAQVVVAVKAHIGNATQRPEQLLWLLDQVASPWLKAAYDYSHFQLQELALADTMDAVIPRSVFIHVKDTEHAQVKRGFLLPGEGTIDYVQMFKRLAASEYRGDVVVEVSGQLSNKPGYDPLAAASKCYNHLANAFVQANLHRG